MPFFESLLNTIEQFGFVSLFLIVLVFFGEGLVFIGLLIPGTIVTIFLGTLAAAGGIDPAILVFFISLGFFLGDSLSYYLGRSGRGLFRSENRILNHAHLERGREFFARHGYKSLILGRFIGPLRPLIPFIAGLAKTEERRFFPLNILSILLWTTISVYLGYFFGQALSVIQLWSSRVEILLLVLAGIVISIYLVKWLVFKKGRAFALYLNSLKQSIRAGIVSNPRVQKFVGSHPRLFSFLGRRLDKNHFYGRPLTYLSLAFAYVLFLFLGVVEDVLASNVIVQVDSRLENLVNAFRSPALVKLFLLITVLGKWHLIVPFTAGLSLIFFFLKKQRYLIPLWLTTFGTIVFTFLGKIAFQRPRPISAVYLESSFAFPSGHATLAVAFFGFLAYFLWRELDSWKQKVNVLFASLAVIIFVGLSRLYLGVHYLSDIWAGYLLGALWLIIGISVMEWLTFKNFDLKIKLPVKLDYARTLIVLVAVLEMAIYAGYVLSYRPPLNPEKFKGLETIITADVLRTLEEKNFSRYSEKLDGSPREPISFIITAGGDEELRDAFGRSGWQEADPLNFDSLAKIAAAAVLNRRYDRAPMTPSFWQAEVNALAFEKPTETGSLRERHHARFWKTNLRTPGGKAVYAGVTGLDVGTAWWVAHRVSEDIDSEREYLWQDLKSTGLVATHKKTGFVEPVSSKNFSRGQFFTDGAAYLVELK